MSGTAITNILFTSGANNPVLASAGIEELSIFRDIPEDLVVEQTEWRDLFDMAYAFQTVDPPRAREFLTAMSKAQVAIAMGDLKKLRRVRNKIAQAIRETTQAEWRKLVERLAERKTAPLRFNDNPLPAVWAQLRRANPSTGAKAQPMLDSHAVQEWPRGSGKLFIPDSEGWHRTQGPNGRTEVEINGRKFIVEDKVSGTPIPFIGEQTRLLHSMEMTPSEDSCSRDFLGVLREAVTDPLVTPHQRFVLRVSHQVGQNRVEESYWVVLWGKVSEDSLPELFVRLREDELNEGEPQIWRFKDFVEMFLHIMQGRNPRGLLVLEPVKDLRGELRKEGYSFEGVN